MRRTIQVCALIVLLGLGLFTKAVAEERPMHEIHSMLVFNFIKYIEWPADAKSGNFVITVVGDDQVASTINTFYMNRTVNGQTVKIVSVKDASQVGRSHVVYLAKRASNQFEDLKGLLEGKPALLITDKPGLGKKGSCINFQEINGKLKFEINQKSFDAHQLKVSQQLAGMGIMI